MESPTADSLGLIANIWSSLLNSLLMDPPSPLPTLGNILQPVSQVEDDKETSPKIQTILLARQGAPTAIMHGASKAAF